MDSLASLEVPAVGYGLRYEFGIFDQTIRDGWQVEITDKWLRFGNPWEIVRPELAYEVKLGGHTEWGTDEQGRYRVRWLPEHVIQGVAYDTPTLGYRVHTCNRMRLTADGTLRLWPLDGGEPRAVTKHATQPNSPVFSPDGGTIYFVASDPASAEERERSRLRDDVFAFEENTFLAIAKQHKTDSRFIA